MPHWLHNWDIRKIRVCLICLLERIFKTAETGIKLGTVKDIFLLLSSFPSVSQQEERQRSNKNSPQVKWIYLTFAAKSLSADTGKGTRFCYPACAILRLASICSQWAIRPRTQRSGSIAQVNCYMKKHMLVYYKDENQFTWKTDQL